MTISRRTEIHNLIFVLGFYLSLSSGGVGLGEAPNVERALISGILVALTLTMLTLNNEISKRLFVTCFAISIICCIQFIRTDNPLIALKKLDGFVFATALVLLFGKYGKSGGIRRFHLSFLKATSIILLLTVLYKLQFGFFQRDVRFFLNGPIVFGWLMGIASIVAVNFGHTYSKKSFYLYAIFFALAMIWTGSKGPIFGYFVGMSYWFISKGQLLRFPVMLMLASLIVYTLMINNLLPERLLLFQRLLDGELAANDFGSVGIRQLMWLDSWGIFIDWPFFGVGLANWPSISTINTNFGDHLVYPHNILAEILSEHGIVGFFIFVSLFLKVFINSANLGRTVFSFVLTSLLFTGDMGYWHFLVALPLSIDLNSRDRT